MTFNIALLRKLALLIVPVLFVFGCDSDNDNDTPPVQAQSSYVRVAHWSPDAPAVDVWVDGNLVLEDVNFNGLSGYLELTEGSHSITVVAANTTSPAVIQETVMLNANTSYTVAATGLLSGTPSIDAWALIDDRTPAGGQAKVRFAHASPDAPNVDIYATGGTTPLFANIPFRSAANYISVAPGSVGLEVRIAGTSDVVVRFAPISLEAGRNYTVVAKGLASPGSIPNALSAYAVVDAPGNGSQTVNLVPVEASTALVRAGHLSPDAPNVDVYVGGMLIAQGYSYRGFSEYVTVSADVQTEVEVFIEGTTTNPVISADVVFGSNEVYSIVATGLAGNSTLGAIVVNDDLTTTDGSRIRFVHAASDAPTVDITLTDGTVLFGNVEFNEALDYIGVPAGVYNLQVRLAGTETVVLSFADVELPSGSVYSIYASGLLSDGTLGAIAVVDEAFPGSTVLSLESAEAEVRVAHLSPDAPNVDVYVDNARVLEDVPFTAVSGYLRVPAKTQMIEVYVAGTTINPVINTTLTWLPNQAYTVAATGLVGSNDLAPIVLVDDRSGDPNGNAHVRFVHTSPDAPAVNIRIAGGGPVLFENVSFREFADYIGVAAATYNLEVVLTSNGQVVLEIPGIELSSSTNYTVFAIGLAGNGTLAALPAVDSQGD